MKMEEKYKCSWCGCEEVVYGVQTRSTSNWWIENYASEEINYPVEPGRRETPNYFSKRIRLYVTKW